MTLLRLEIWLLPGAVASLGGPRSSSWTCEGRNGEKGSGVTQGQPRIVGNARKQGPPGLGPTPSCILPRRQASVSISSHAELSRISRAFRHVSKESEYNCETLQGKCKRQQMQPQSREHDHPQEQSHPCLTASFVYILRHKRFGYDGKGYYVMENGRE